MKQLTLNEVKTVIGSGAGGVKSPDAPTRGDEKVDQSTNADGSYQPATLPVETNTPDEG